MNTSGREVKVKMNCLVCGPMVVTLRVYASETITRDHLMRAGWTHASLENGYCPRHSSAIVEENEALRQ